MRPHCRQAFRESTCGAARAIEVRLAGRRSLAADGIRHSTAVVFGAGDFRMRTEDRPLPPELAVGDRLALGPLRATVEEILGSSTARAARVRRLTRRDLGGPRAPRPPDPILARRDTAGALGCVDADRRSTGCVRAAVGRLRARLERAGIPEGAGSSSSRPSRTPRASPPLAIASWMRSCRLMNHTAFPQPPHWQSAVRGREAGVSSRSARRLCGRWSMRLRSTARCGPATGLATQRIGSASRLRVVDAILSGTHEPGTSHYELLRAFADEEHSEPHGRGAQPSRLSHARIRRFRFRGADRARRAG